MLPSFDDVVDHDFSSSYHAVSSAYNTSRVESNDIYASEVLNAAPLASKAVMLDVSNDCSVSDLDQILHPQADNDEVSLCLTNQADDQNLHKLLSSFSTELPRRGHLEHIEP